MLIALHATKLVFLDKKAALLVILTDIEDVEAIECYVFMTSGSLEEWLRSKGEGRVHPDSLLAVQTIAEKGEEPLYENSPIGIEKRHMAGMDASVFLSVYGITRQVLAEMEVNGK